jgi:serine/threonine protein kinase
MAAELFTDETIFLEAVEYVPAERWDAFIKDRCGDDSELLHRVECLLRAHRDLGDFPDRRPVVPEIGVVPSLSASPGTQIGPYKIREQIGEGGMGEVYVAEQDRPVRRKVALKIIRPGMATRDVIARFEAERQALALMDHPNIAKVFDAGTVGEVRSAECGVRSEKDDSPVNSEFRTPNSELENTPHSEFRTPHSSGPPFFVMELVQGPPITDYCDAKRLTTRERLQLFLSVCRAVQHAHQKGIIHRDLKPSNVLVPEIDGAAVPKVIDFGVAKAIDQKLTEKTVYTQFSQMIGTPTYMSPEQAGLGVVDVDTRSDIYSLGVLLYELLTGTTPFDGETLRHAGFEEMQRIIREQEPRRPSAQVSTLAAETLTTVAHRRGSDPKKLRDALSGELDWIVMKCLEKDRSRRYETPNSLARDVEAYLQDQPVQACPPSTVYRLRKYVRRNRVPLTVATLLLAGLAYLAYSNAAIKRERNAKTMAMARAKAISDLFQVSLSTPERGGRILGRQFTVPEVLDGLSASMSSVLAGQPEAEAEMRVTIGLTYFYLGLPDRAEPHLKRLIELRRQIDGPQHDNVADSLVRYGQNLYAQERYDDAEPFLLEALEMYRQLGIRDDDPIHTLATLQQVLASSGRHDEAERVIDQAWESMQKDEGLSPEFRMYVNNYCGAFACYFATIGRPERAAEFADRAALAADRLRNPIEYAQALTGLAIVRLRLGDEAGYRAVCAELVQLAPRIADDQVKLNCIRNPTLGRDTVDDPTLLVRLAEDFAANNSLGTPNIDRAVLGAAHFRAGHYEEAVRHLEASIANFSSDGLSGHRPGLGSVLMPQLLLAMTKWQLGEQDEARRMLREIQLAIEKSLRSPSTYWDLRAVLEIRRQEAEAMINPKEADEAVQNEGPSHADATGAPTPKTDD